MWHTLKARLLGFLAYGLLRLLSRSWRYIIEDSDIQNNLDTPVWIFAHWHGDELALLPLAKRFKLVTMVSKSHDGEIMASVLKKLGVQVVRGSSSRNSVGALKTLIRSSQRESISVSFAVDGPRGPRHKAKPGILYLHESLGERSKLFAVGVFCDRKWIFTKSWNQAYLPKWNALLKVVFRQVILDPAWPVETKLQKLEEAILKSSQEAQIL